MWDWWWIWDQVRGAVVDEAVSVKWKLTITMEGPVATFGKYIWQFLQNQFSSNTTKATSLHKRSTLCPTQTGIDHLSHGDGLWINFGHLKHPENQGCNYFGVRSTAPALKAIFGIIVYWHSPSSLQDGTSAFPSLKLQGPFFGFYNLFPGSLVLPLNFLNKLLL